MKRMAMAVLLLLVPVLGTLAVEAQGSYVSLCSVGAAGESWDGFAEGAVVSSFTWGGTVGVTVNVAPIDPRDGPAVIFDSDCTVSGGCTGGDTDLTTRAGERCNPTNLAPRGKVLICQDDAYKTSGGAIIEPGDSAQGCTFVFTFDQAIGLNQFGFLDIENSESGAEIKMYDSVAGGSLVQSCNIPPGTGQCSSGDTSVGNNSWQSVACNGTNVKRLEINMVGSGSITDMCGFGPTPVVVSGFAARGTPGVAAVAIAIAAVSIVASAAFFVLRGGTQQKPPQHG